METATQGDYLLNFWGEIMDHSYIQDELGIGKDCLWFETAAERKEMRLRLKSLADKHHVFIAFAEYEGPLTHKRTVLELAFEYDGKEYVIEHDFGYGFPVEGAQYMFEEGNYSCDCNRSIFINDAYPEFPEFGCGDSIQMKRLQVHLRT